ncbi:MAG TPA: beta-galactosidase [Candidatus Merdivicinus intestinigallinarum]|nr:beta-galactosidase [Candidatus Merdivicinus intestinigallinarum]
MEKFPPLVPAAPGLIHGGDYNPDQWLGYPDVLQEDVRLMKLAGVNSASVAIFAWAALEPEEGKYDFEWLDETFDRLWKAGVRIILATPSGARPAWMDAKYPEVLRVNADRTKNLHGLRHNHCFTSPYYRQKVREMNRMLAERYGKHPALMMWHLSNEYGGECHCPLCQEAFRNWLRKKYDNDIEKLNHEWWTYFWSHRYTSFDQIESPSPLGDKLIHGMNLDWKRFVTEQTMDFIRNEMEPLREITPNIPVTTNLMGFYDGLDYWKLSQILDVVSWDNYPLWGNDSEKLWETASHTAFIHDMNRCFLKGKPFMLMESVPSKTNWHPCCKLKRPGMHLLSSMQAVAHGSDSVQYFQWRKGRGASEKFHGAVVDHCGRSDTMEFLGVKSVGDLLKKLPGVAGTSTKSQAAVLYDWENRWAIEDFQGTVNKESRRYVETCVEHYRPLWKRGVSTDIVSEDSDLSGYRLLAAPMLYMLRPGVAQKLRDFAEQGGTLILTHLTGYVNENDLCFLGGFPGDGMMDTAGIWCEDIDTVYPSDENFAVSKENHLGFAGRYPLGRMREIVHPAEGTEVLAAYEGDFYAGMPVLTCHPVGKGRVYYIASAVGPDFLEELYSKLIPEAGVSPCLPVELPEGVSVTLREGGGQQYYFFMNFTEMDQRVSLPAGTEFTDMDSGGTVRDLLDLPPYGVRILKK